MYQKLTPRKKRVILARLSRLPVWGHPAFRISFRQEGLKGFVFGGRSGPTLGYDMMLHELAHCVQFGAQSYPSRMLPWGGFRFHVATIEIGGEKYPHPVTPQATLREVETLAIELHLYEMVGRKHHWESYAANAARLTEFLPDWACIPRDSRLDWVAERLRFFYARWTKERIAQELTAWFDAQLAHWLLTETTELAESKLAA